MPIKKGIRSSCISTLGLLMLTCMLFTCATMIDSQWIGATWSTNQKFYEFVHDVVALCPVFGYAYEVVGNLLRTWCLFDRKENNL